MFIHSNKNYKVITIFKGQYESKYMCNKRLGWNKDEEKGSVLIILFSIYSIVVIKAMVF